MNQFSFNLYFFYTFFFAFFGAAIFSIDNYGYYPDDMCIKNGNCTDFNAQSLVIYNTTLLDAINQYLIVLRNKGIVFVNESDLSLFASFKLQDNAVIYANTSFDTTNYDKAIYNIPLLAELLLNHQFFYQIQNLQLKNNVRIVKINVFESVNDFNANSSLQNKSQINDYYFNKKSFENEECTKIC